MKILILGVNGFIGNALVRRILATRDWEVFGMDLHSNKITEVLDNPRFHYLEGDIAINKEWIEYHIKKCDVVLPLVATGEGQFLIEGAQWEGEPEFLGPVVATWKDLVGRRLE